MALKTFFKNLFTVNIFQSRARWVLFIVAGVAVLGMPLLKFPQSAFWVRVVGYTGLYIILGLGLNLQVGFTGLLDLGYVAFYAIGAYTYALLASDQFGIHLSFWVVLPLQLCSRVVQACCLDCPCCACVVIIWQL